MKFIISLFCSIAFAQVQDLTLSVRYSESLKWDVIGLMKLPKSRSQSASIVLTKGDNIIEKQKVSQDGYVSLMLESKSGLKYMAHIDGKQFNQLNWKGQNQEIVQLVVEGDQLLGFDYAVRPVRKGADYVSVIYKEINEAPQGQTLQQEEKLQSQSGDVPEQPQGFIGMLMQYKWYIIIGFVVFFMLGQADPQKLNETVQQAQQEATQQTQRRKK